MAANSNIRLGTQTKDIKRFRSGMPGLDAALGDPRGIPGRTIMELIAEPKCGKSTLSYLYVGNAQKDGVKEITIPNPADKKNPFVINAAWLDFERSFDADYAEMLGVDTSKLLVVEPPYAEEAFQILEELLAAGLQIAVIDSVSMAIPSSEEDKQITENEKMASMAGLMTRESKRLIMLADNANALVIMINQFRANISTLSRVEKKPAGAKALHYAAKVMLFISRIKNGERLAEVEFFVEKTKFGPERKKVNANLVYGEGFDVTKHVIDMAVELGIVEQAGAYFYYPSRENPEYKGQGIEQAKENLPIETIKVAVQEALLANKLREG